MLYHLMVSLKEGAPMEISIINCYLRWATLDPAMLGCLHLFVWFFQALMIILWGDIGRVPHAGDAQASRYQGGNTHWGAYGTTAVHIHRTPILIWLRGRLLLSAVWLLTVVSAAARCLEPGWRLLPLGQNPKLGGVRIRWHLLYDSHYSCRRIYLILCIFS